MERQKVIVVTDNLDEPKNMTEKELKNHVNSLRHQIRRLNDEIRKSIDNVKLHRESANKLREKRDELNARVKECTNRAEICRKARDDINQRIVDSKKQRDEMQKQINQTWNHLNQLKEKRDKLNSIAKMHTTSLEKAYTHELYIFTHADIPLKHEIDAFKRLKELGERLNVSREADAIHSELIPGYKKTKELRKDADRIHQDIQNLANESQQHHDGLLGIYKELDGLRKEANLYHARLNDEYHNIKPLSKSIDAQKAVVANLRDELSECLDALKGKQRLINTENGIERDNALEKFKTTGRMSLKELQILMEHKDISFD